MSNLKSITKLTEFPRLEPKEKTDGLLSKFMWWRKPDVAEKAENADSPSSSSSSGPNEPSVSLSQEAVVTEIKSRPPRPTVDVSASLPSLPHHKGPSSSPLPAYYRSDSTLSNRSTNSPDILDGSVSPFTFEARTLPNVLRRISSLIAMGTHNQSDIKKYWMPDSVSKECYECAEKFTTFRRKHHCRICGQIFCSRCCNQEIPGKIIGYSGDLRVCTYCSKIVLSYLQSALSSDMSEDLRLVQEDLQNRFGSSDTLHNTPSYGLLASEHPSSYRSLPRRKISLGYQEERFATTRSYYDNVFDSVVDDKQKSLGDFVNLKGLWDELTHPVTGMDWATHRHNMMKNYHSCVVGSELVDWLLAQRKISWRGQGTQIGQMLIDACLIECVSQAEQIFLDAYALYRPIQLPLPPLKETSEAGSTRSSRDYGDVRDNQDPLWVKQISSSRSEEESSSTKGSTSVPDQSPLDPKPRLPSTASLYSLDLNLSESKVTISKPREDRPSSWDPYSNSISPIASSTGKASTPKPPRKNPAMSITTETMTDEFLTKTLQLQREQGKEFVAPSGWHSPQQLTNDNELLAFQRLCNAFIRHENEFLNHLLDSMNLPQSWADVILPIVHKVTEIVRPDVRHADDEMDIRHYVQFKKVPGGRKEDCRIVNGVVCTKNVINRAMRPKLKDPKILLISSSIDYQRFENRFLSLEPLMMQEYEYLRNTVARITSLQPDLVLVEKTVSRLAQDMMLEMGITLVINVKPSVMERVARCCQAVITTSADTQIGIGRPQLGMCHNFYVENFSVAQGSQKNLMFFDGCAMHLGCTVLLRGGQLSELVRVKRIISLLTFVAYNWRLERSFHIDLFAMPPDSSAKRDTFPDMLESPGGSEDFVSATEDLDSSKSITDPAESPCGGKAETTVEKKFAKSEVCDDFSDPLQSYLATEGEEPPPLPRDDSCEKLVVQFVPDASKYTFRTCLDEVPLSASPFIKYSLPYLETEAGKKCALRKFFPDQIYWSPLLSRDRKGSAALQDVYSSNNTKANNIQRIVPQVSWKQPHPFISLKITVPVAADDIQASIADFRRKGGMLDFGSEGDRNSSNGVSSHLNSWNLLDCEKSTTAASGGRVDALDPFKHQKLSVLFCSYSPMSCNAPYFCVNPWVVHMDMYGRHDISLGMFLERYCFRRSYHCPARNCDAPMLYHTRRFVHEDGCVTVASKELESPILGSGENILMWNWCVICKTVSPIVPMSADAWSLSFAKYLELRFHGYLYERRGFDHSCSHSLHHDFIHYFAQHNIISWFKFSKIRLWEISIPSKTLSIKSDPKSVNQLIDDVKVVAITGHGVYSSILEALMSLKETSIGARAEEVLTSHLEHLKAERMVFRSKIEEIQINLTLETEGLSKKEVDSFLWKITDSIGFLRSSIADTIQSWNVRLSDLLALRKKEEKQAKGSTTTKVESENAVDSGVKNIVSKIESESVLPSFATALPPAVPPRDLDDSLKSSDQASCESSGEFRSKDTNSMTSGSTVDVSISGVLDVLTNGSIPYSFDTPLSCAEDFVSGSDNSQGTANNNYTKGVEGARSLAVCPPSPSHSSRSSDRDHHERSKSDGTEKILKSNNSDVATSEDSPDFKMEKKLGSSAVKTLISHFLSGSAVGQVVQSPWLSSDHHFKAELGFIPVSVHENEPSSVAAFALSSFEYRNKLAELNKTSQGKLLRSSEDEDLVSKKAKYSDSSAPDELLLSAGLLLKAGEPEKPVIEMEVDDKDRDRNNPKNNNGNIEVQFSSATAKFYCRIYFAEQFRQLRQVCLVEPEEFYIRSIAHCIPWNATGGKSGSTFCKTVDDRFVVKQMSKFEIQSFLDFAPKYFDYVKGAQQSNKPTVLAKVLGVYRIGFRNSATNAQSKMDILIMENLFYERNISQKFDLKGSIRNRLATVSGKEQEDLVLLDENLVNMACEHPLYIRPHTKTVLTMALTNDSQFLSSQMVMDYSLLVGFDEVKNELVVGIIDYIRTFTWDKKIETFVKSSGILGGQGKMPTVVSPEEYQTRFCEAMDRYFLLVPDRWIGLGLGVDS